MSNSGQFRYRFDFDDRKKNTSDSIEALAFQLGMRSSTKREFSGLLGPRPLVKWNKDYHLFASIRQFGTNLVPRIPKSLVARLVIKRNNLSRFFESQLVRPISAWRLISVVTFRQGFLLFVLQFWVWIFSNLSYTKHKQWKTFLRIMNTSEGWR